MSEERKQSDQKREPSDAYAEVWRTLDALCVNYLRSPDDPQRRLPGVLRMAHTDAILRLISRHTPTEASIQLPTVDVPVRDENGWGRLRIETVPEYLADRERLRKALTSLAKVWPYVAKHADHIDGEYNLALDDVKRCVEWAIGISESVIKPTGLHAPNGGGE